MDDPIERIYFSVSLTLLKLKSLTSAKKAKASSNAGDFSTKKRVYNRNMMVIVASIGNRIMITTMGPAFEA